MQLHIYQCVARLVSDSCQRLVQYDVRLPYWICMTSSYCIRELYFIHNVVLNIQIHWFDNVCIDFHVS